MMGIRRRLRHKLWLIQILLNQKNRSGTETVLRTVGNRGTRDLRSDVRLSQPPVPLIKCCISLRLETLVLLLLTAVLLLTR